MSLSRYFQNTPAFKAENLVKTVDKSTPGWVPGPRKDTQPFQAEKTHPSVPAHAGTFVKETPSAHLHSEPKSGNDGQVPHILETVDNSTPPESPEKIMDLSRYMERSVAERIASEAYLRGLAEGKEKTEHDYGTAVKALLLVCQQLDTLRTTIISNSSSELLDFALAIADKILHLSVREQDHTIVATIEEALRRAVKSDEFTIHIHPDDYDILAAKSPELIAGLSGLNNIVIRKDAEVERGGALIESDNCTVDATISGQFATIREEIKNKLNV